MASHRVQPDSVRRRATLYVALALAVALIATGGWQLWERHRATDGTASNIAAPATTPGQQLDEKKVPISQCDAADDEPRIIALGSLDVEGCIQKVGQTGNQIEAPGNIHVAGWFTGSALPGAAGLSIIDGHSSGRFKDGIFNGLGEFETGSVLTVEYGDGNIRHFEVTSVQTHPVKDTMSRLRADAAKESANLALITCGGEYDAKDHSYEDRVVVLAANA